MTAADVAELVAYYLGAFGIGWSLGLGILAFRKFVEGAT